MGEGIENGTSGITQLREENTMSNPRDAARAGIGFGSALAITISWSIHKSILWAILQGFFGWLYVIYFALTRS